jgi:hypothetical protein
LAECPVDADASTDAETWVDAAAVLVVSTPTLPWPEADADVFV